MTPRSHEKPGSMLRFVKYHALGNDFIIRNGFVDDRELLPEQVRALCDRHRGIGADNVLTVRPHPGVDALMRVQNADGSEAGQCGNGLRCCARFLFDEGLVEESRADVVLAVQGASHRVRRVRADRFVASMGHPSYRHDDLPLACGAFGEIEIMVAGRVFEASAVHFGNPHLVIFDEESPWKLAEHYGALLEGHPSFIARTNVGFGRFIDGGVEAVVYERGDGITQACGSGACALTVTAVNKGLWQEGMPLEVRLPGGVLQVTVSPSGEAELAGEAVRVFCGEVPCP